ncbi:MAG TPA: dihydrofolate reductase family protein [Bacteroidia bacterium]|nr:dihydrofolate reductase family protein [Bacteroidia bacterium]
MRKLKLQVQISIDGFIAGLKGEMDWITFDLDNDILKYISDLNKDIDCILLGRKLAEGFIPHWKTEATDPTKKREFVERMSGQYDFAKKMHETSKVVFTKSLEKNEWENTVLASGNLKEEITKLKKQSRSLSGGKDLIVYGGGTLVSSLIKEELIDELHLFVNPTAIGNGMTIFKGLESKRNFKLIKAIPFECGIVVLHYETK